LTFTQIAAKLESQILNGLREVEMKRLFLVAVAILVLSIISCAPSASQQPTQSPPTQPANTIAWDEAKDYIGERITVYGPVVDTHWATSSNGKPTFLNIGKSYPAPERFTVVIWMQNRSNFSQAPDVYYLGKSIYVTGLIEEYRGSPQIEVKTPSQIEED